MKFIDSTCPHCGAQLKIDSESKTAYCEFCGAQLMIDDDAQPMSIDNAEDLGYRFEKGRQRAQNEANAQQESYPPAAHKKRHIFWWVMGWIFIFPIPVTILTARSKKPGIWIKVLIIAAAWLTYLLIGISARS